MLESARRWIDAVLRTLTILVCMLTLWVLNRVLEVLGVEEEPPE